MVVGSIIAYQKKMHFIYIATLFKDEVRKQGGSDAFVKKRINSWNKPDRLLTHMGKPPDSTHIIFAQIC